MPGQWKHTTRPISFTLVVDDFGVKYVGKEHVEHLMTVLQEHYQIKADWTGNRYIGIHMAWDYEKGQVHLYMPICATSAQALSTHTNEDTKPTIPPHRNQIWSQNTICQTGIQGSPCKPHGKEIHPTSMR